MATNGKTDWLTKVREFHSKVWFMNKLNDAVGTRQNSLREALLDAVLAMRAKVRSDDINTLQGLKKSATYLALALGPVFSIDSLHEPNPNVELEELCQIVANVMWCNCKSPNYDGLIGMNNRWIADTLALVLCMVEKCSSTNA